MIPFKCYWSIIEMFCIDSVQCLCVVNANKPSVCIVKIYYFKIMKFFLNSVIPNEIIKFYFQTEHELSVFH